MTLTNRQLNHPLGIFRNLDRLLNQAAKPRPVSPSTNGPGIYDYETDTAYILRIEIPGFTREEIALSAEAEELKIKAESERYDRIHEETFTYPDDVQLDAITAKLENGILELTLPKHEKQEPQVHKIEIQTTNSPSNQ